MERHPEVWIGQDASDGGGRRDSVAQTARELLVSSRGRYHARRGVAGKTAWRIGCRNRHSEQECAAAIGDDRAVGETAQIPVKIARRVVVLFHFNELRLDMNLRRDLIHCLN